MLDLDRLSHIKGLQRDGEAVALYAIALNTPVGKPIVELGTFHGYTAGVLAMAAEETNSPVITIDDYAPRPEQRLPAHIGAAAVRENLTRAGLHVAVLQGDSRDVPNVIREVGMLWIDSTHTAEQVEAEMAAWLPLIAPGGIVAFHDYGGASTPQLKGPIDAMFRHSPMWEQIGAFYTVIAFRRIGACSCSIRCACS